MAVANATLISKHPSNIMVEGPAQISKKQEMEAKHDLELERTKNKRELQVAIVYNKSLSYVDWNYY